MSARSVQNANGSITIRWLGHASFRITTTNGTTIITDPIDFKGYHMPPDTRADIVTVSHEHPDHNCVHALADTSIVLRGTNSNLAEFYRFDTTIGDVKIYTVNSYHSPGRFGNNAIFVFEFDEIRLAHLGDMGTVLTEQQIAELGRIDVLMIPAGGQFTIAAAEADTIVGQLHIERLVLPMHYKTEAFDVLPYSADLFLKDKENVRTLETKELFLDLSESDAKRAYVVMRY